MTSTEYKINSISSSALRAAMRNHYIDPDKFYLEFSDAEFNPNFPYNITKPRMYTINRILYPEIIGRGATLQSAFDDLFSKITSDADVTNKTVKENTQDVMKQVANMIYGKAANPEPLSVGQTRLTFEANLDIPEYMANHFHYSATTEYCCNVSDVSHVKTVFKVWVIEWDIMIEEEGESLQEVINRVANQYKKYLSEKGK